ncbi:hypothetical protein PENARI_c013G00164 [Penicillium arizonense]|uniref:Uncharacterized protein n=1 Tax=Penicillium arizonense TaxID=1835702 RepID=A0A1F5LDX7_PENAI|nr:hypothetical protein PENARI_c013G00164 [Penicillium arizonense]OGE51355.1 hypothetical protein PENARI_c013G00164 [Penicillium arizonense]
MDNRLLQECMQPLAVAIFSYCGWSMGEKSLNAWLSILQFPDSTTATMLSPATSPRFHVQAAFASRDDYVLMQEKRYCLPECDGSLHTPVTPPLWDVLS